MNFIKTYWWKLLGILLLIYAVIFGLGVPLKHGIMEVSPLNAKAGEQFTLSIQGYNSHYSDLPSYAYLKLDSVHYLKSAFCSPTHQNIMRASFLIPTYLPSADSVVDATLIVDNRKDGYAILPRAISISQDSFQVERGQELWSSSNGLEDVTIDQSFKFPFRNILHETVRNTFYHVSLWFAMFILLIVSLYYAVGYLRKPSAELDRKAYAYTAVAIFYGILGLISGSIWAKYTWGTFWTADVKLNMTAVAMLIYFAYLVLRSSIPDMDRRAKLSSVYSIFAFFALIALVFVIPRLTDSLHPGNGGNPALGGEDLDNTLRLVFYPAIIGFTLLGAWIAQLKFRVSRIEENDAFNER